MHRETKSSHNPTGPPREIRVFFSPSPQSSQLLGAGFSCYARSTHGGLSPSLLQQNDTLPFLLSWADLTSQRPQEPVAPWVGTHPSFCHSSCWCDGTWQGWSPISSPAGASPAHHGARARARDGALPAFLPNLHSAITRCEWKHLAGRLPAEVIYSLEMSAGLFCSPFLPLSLPPLLLPDPHLAEQMKCQEEMSLRRASSLWGISCTLIMVFVLWVVKFPSTSPVWS